jgi:septum formation protein
MQIVLASSSKNKSDILNNVHLKHITCSSTVDESSLKTNVYEWAKEVAEQKAENVRNQGKEGIIIGVDTIVYFNDKILTKPKDLNEARKVVKELSGKTNSVITGICLIDTINNRKVATYDESLVTMRSINDEDIENYLNNEKYILNASGYVIETMMSCFLDKINGSYYNILGMPVDKIYEELEKWGYRLKDFNN